MRRFIKKIHIWLSIPAGLIITMICLTGAILVFQTEILEVCYPERYFVKEVKQDKIPLNELIPLVNSQLKDNSVASIKVTSEPKRTYTATLSEGFRVWAYVDPYTGEITGESEYGKGFFYTILSLHRWLMDGTHTWGKYTVGITTILFVFILISGLIWWVPSDKKRLKSRLKVKTNSGMKRFLHDAHVALGMYASIFLLVCSLTGLMWSFEWYRNAVAALFGIETTQPDSRGRGGHSQGGGQRDKKNEVIDSQIWQQAFDNVAGKVVDYNYITIENGSATVLAADAPHLRATDKYSFDKKSGNITKSVIYSEQKSVSKLMTWAYALHVGAFGGIIVRILTCLACIIGATLPLTGYYIFYRKHLKNSSKKRSSKSLVS